ncbi:Inactive receptor kinase [Quillaja saponaria]|uniref:Inactive receptor kinase n=1 Tax=Quillaja saponaria TaxID=32244 RepID=A0AAD7LT39_QUISA|nr:Inactive receptor kinase [Quillaja saponaria]
MHGKKDFSEFLKGLLVCVVVIPFLIMECKGGELSESESIFNFIRALDPQDVLKIGWLGSEQNPCLLKLKGIRCNLQATNIVEIRLENLNLSGLIDADSLCKLENLRVVNLARNKIQGNIPNSILSCRRLAYLNLSSNSLSGRMPLDLSKLKYLRSLDISNNKLYGIIPHQNEVKHIYKYLNVRVSQRKSIREGIKVRDTLHIASEPPSTSTSDPGKTPWYDHFVYWIPLFVGMGLFLLFTYFVGKKAARLSREGEMLNRLDESPVKVSPIKVSPINVIEEVMLEETHSELVLFVDEDERFKLEDLLGAAADLRKQTVCSSLYKVMLKNNALYAVKRLKKLQVSFQEFAMTLRQIGNLKHPNILPLVGYHSTNEEKLLIYKFQTNGSLLNLLEDYMEGKKDFPWKHRLCIAYGIARGLMFIYKKLDDKEIIPHGNLKLSNILLNENEQPVISEYGFSKFMDPEKACLFSSHGKSVEGTGIDLPKWVRAMVREEWTGEVFDKEVSGAGSQWAFPLLNIALKCVSHSPEDRPTAGEVVEKIEEVMQGQQEHDSVPATSSHDCCLLHSIISDTWDSPGSNY